MVTYSESGVDIDLEAKTVSEIAENIGYYMAVCGGLDSCENYLKDLDGITCEDVKNAANEYLALNSYVLSILLPDKN